MSAVKPKPILIVTVLLLVLAVLSTASILTNRIGFARPAGFANGTNFQRNGGNGGNFQYNNDNGGTGNGSFPINNGNGNFQRRGGFNTFGILRSLGLNGSAILYINLGIGILGILLVLLSAYGVWHQKSWGLNLAMVMAVLFLFGAVPRLFSLGARINWLRLSISILTLAASVPILVYGILPSVRDMVSDK